MTLLIDYTNRLWLCDINPDEEGDALLAWLDDWAETLAADEEPPDCAGRIHMSQCGSDLRQNPAVSGGPAGFKAILDNFTISVAAGDGPLEAEIAFQAGCAQPSLFSALRILSMYSVLSEGGLALHASSVRFGDEALLFAGPAGTGKTTAADAFPAKDRLDRDLVYLAERDGRWMRLCARGPDLPPAPDAQVRTALPVGAVLLPSAAESFKMERLDGAEAVSACLHTPPPGLLPDGREGSGTARLLESACRLTSNVPVLKVGWAIGEDLPSLLSAALAQMDGGRK